MTKVGTELLQAVNMMKDAIPARIPFQWAIVRIGNSETLPENVKPVMDSLLEAGFVKGQTEVRYSAKQTRFELRQSPSHSGLDLAVTVEYRATEQDKLEGLLQEQAQLQEKINKLQRKSADDTTQEREVV